MMVPRSFAYSSAASPPASSPPMAPREDKSRRTFLPKRSVPKSSAPPTPKPLERTSSTPAATVASQPVAVPTPHRAASQTMPCRQQRRPSSAPRRKKPSAHDPNALPPAVAALLAVTAIPPRRPGSFRRASSAATKISIDELVNEWKSDEALVGSYSSSPALEVLLEDTQDVPRDFSLTKDSMKEDSYMNVRSVSCDSVPSLDMDSRSVLSVGSPSTPASLRSRRSSANLKKEKSRSLPVAEDAMLDHPLSHPAKQDDEGDGLISYPQSGKSTPAKSKFSFKSNLTTSLQALRNAAISSISSFTLSSMTAPAQRSSSQSAFTDEMLWAHPYIFPRMTSEFRPVLDGTPSEAQRRYLNPMPLTFEEQEAPYQQALHAPFLAEQPGDVPNIQLQTYNRGKRKSVSKRVPATDPQSEAGRALLAAAGVRQREVRENSDFLRVVVLEMNMRRVGKLETGKARIWLPPRQISLTAADQCAVESEGIPRRWVGEVAAY